MAVIVLKGKSKVLAQIHVHPYREALIVIIRQEDIDKNPISITGTIREGR